MSLVRSFVELKYPTSQSDYRIIQNTMDIFENNVGSHNANRALYFLKRFSSCLGDRQSLTDIKSILDKYVNEYLKFDPALTFACQNAYQTYENHINSKFIFKAQFLDHLTKLRQKIEERIKNNDFKATAEEAKTSPKIPKYENIFINEYKTPPPIELKELASTQKIYDDLTELKKSLLEEKERKERLTQDRIIHLLHCAVCNIKKINKSLKEDKEQKLRLPLQKAKLSFLRHAIDIYRDTFGTMPFKTAIGQIKKVIAPKKQGKKKAKKTSFDETDYDIFLLQQDFISLVSELPANETELYLDLIDYFKKDTHINDLFQQMNECLAKGTIAKFRRLRQEIIFYYGYNKELELTSIDDKFVHLFSVFSAPFTLYEFTEKTSGRLIEQNEKENCETIENFLTFLHSMRNVLREIQDDADTSNTFNLMLNTIAKNIMFNYLHYAKQAVQKKDQAQKYHTLAQKFLLYFTTLIHRTARKGLRLEVSFARLLGTTFKIHAAPGTDSITANQLFEALLPLINQHEIEIKMHSSEQTPLETKEAKIHDALDQLEEKEEEDLTNVSQEFSAEFEAWLHDIEEKVKKKKIKKAKFSPGDEKSESKEEAKDEPEEPIIEPKPQSELDKLFSEAAVLIQEHKFDQAIDKYNQCQLLAVKDNDTIKAPAAILARAECYKLKIFHFLHQIHLAVHDRKLELIDQLIAQVWESYAQASKEVGDALDYCKINLLNEKSPHPELIKQADQLIAGINWVVQELKENEVEVREKINRFIQKAQECLSMAKARRLQLKNNLGQLRWEYDVLEMTVEDKELPIEKIQTLAIEHVNKPILIKHGNEIKVYGHDGQDGSWGFTQLKSSEFKNHVFPATNNVRNTPRRYARNLIKEIEAKRAHWRSFKFNPTPKTDGNLKDKVWNDMMMLGLRASNALERSAIEFIKPMVDDQKVLDEALAQEKQHKELIIFQKEIPVSTKMSAYIESRTKCMQLLSKNSEFSLGSSSATFFSVSKTEAEPPKLEANRSIT